MYNQNQNKNNCSPCDNGPCKNQQPSQDPSCEQQNYSPAKNKKQNKPCKNKNQNQNNY